MAFSSPFLPRPLPPRIPTLRSELSLYITSSLPPPRPHCRRKNHLRPKILNSPLPPSPPPPPPPPSPSPPLHEPFESSYATGSSLLFVEEGEAEEETFAACEVSDAFPPGTPHRWFPGSVLYLASRFAALLVVQTAAAVWLLSREDAKEVGGGSNDGGFKENEKVKESGMGIEVEDFDRMVVEIREMAREVREREAEGIVGDGGVKEEVNKRAGRGRKSISMLVMDGNEDGLVAKKDKRRLKLRSRGVGYLPKAKGFGGSKPIRSESDLGKDVDVVSSPITLRWDNLLNTVSVPTMCA